MDDFLIAAADLYRAIVVAVVDNDDGTDGLVDAIRDAASGLSESEQSVLEAVIAAIDAVNLGMVLPIG